MAGQALTAAPPPAVSRPVLETLEAAWAASLSPATRRAYATAWQAWESWAAAHDAAALPAAPEAVAAYLAARWADGAGLATLRMGLAAIGAAHDIRQQPSPCKDRAVTKAMRGFARMAADAGRSVKQAKGLDAEAVAVIRGSMNGKADTPRGALTMAIVSVLAVAGLRRSEAAALVWADIAREADGSGRMLIRKSKTDQAADGAVVAITPDAMADLERLASLKGRADDQPVFGVSARTISRRIAAAAKAAGLGSGYSGHSGRVGMAQRMTANGAPAAATMRQGRWRSTRMVARYTRAQSAAEALRYL